MNDEWPWTNQASTTILSAKLEHEQPSINQIKSDQKEKKKSRFGEEHVQVQGSEDEWKT